MKKIILSLSVITVVAALGVIGTVAYFSDVETSTGNVLQAGNLDLKVDSDCHYWTDEDADGQYTDVGCGQAGNWSSTDLTVEKFFDFNDLKPGDKGENTISLTAVDNDAFICGYVTNLQKDDNGCNEPESKVDSTCGAGEGELQRKVHVKIWQDTGLVPVGGVEPVGYCDNIWQPEEAVLVEDEVIDNNHGGWPLGQIPGDERVCLGVAWWIPTDVGNIIQSDSVSADISFYAEQVRNNTNFSCPERPPVEPVVVTP